LQLLNAREKVFRPQGFLFSGKDPVASLSPLRGIRGDGILYFQLQVWSAPAERSGDGALSFISNRMNPERCRAVLATALQIFVVALAILSTTSCSRAPNQSAGSITETREVTDEAGRRVRLPLKIERIVSLAPNLTEIVFAVGAGDRLVGRTRYCDYPPEVKSVAEIGDTMTPSIERIIALKPQIVLVSTASQLEAFTKQLEQQKIAVYVTNPRSLDEVFRSITTLGDLFGMHDRADKLISDLRRRADAVTAAVDATKPVPVFYQVSDEPLYTIGRDSYLTDLVRRAGGVSVTADVPTAFPRFSDEAALAARPEAIILPTGGSMATANSTVASPLKNSPAVLNNRVYKINEDHLQRPGPRLVDGLEEMARALHPEVFK
jgi:iron complex transport system substrate-binding protein